MFFECQTAPVRGIEESDWAASLAPAGIEVRSRAVLAGSGSAEY